MPIKINDELFQAYFSRVYQQTQGMQVSYTDSEYESFVSKGVCITYGELLYASVKKMICKMRLTEQDVFLDLGSGVGKCALQVFMQSQASTVIGIEASSLLHQHAVLASDQVQVEFPLFWEMGRSLLFCEGNFLNSDWQNATTVYTCSTCFTKALLIAIANKINQIPSVRQVLSLRPIPFLNLPLERVFSVECSWDSALCFLYRR